MEFDSNSKKVTEALNNIIMEDKTMRNRERIRIHDRGCYGERITYWRSLEVLARAIIGAGFSECAFSDFEYYPVLVKEFPEVEELTDTEERFVIEMIEAHIG